MGFVLLVLRLFVHNILRPYSYYIAHAWAWDSWYLHRPGRGPDSGPGIEATE